jgi:gliding motility-associated-like protein
VLTACDSTVWGGTTYTTSGMYNDTLVSASGCDSIITLDLAINYSYNNDTTVITACDSVEWKGISYNSTGFYYDTLQSIAGCDSIITLELSIINSYFKIDTIYACNGDSALLNGSYQKVSGIYIDTLVSASGCDSILSNQLIFDTVLYSTNSLEICYGDSSLFGGIYYKSNGTYYDTLQAQAGCDSVSKLVLSLRNLNVGDTTTLKVCSENTFNILWNSKNYDSTGVYTDTLQSNLGCDSLVTLDLTIYKSYNIIESKQICLNDSALIFGIYQKFSGTYYDSSLTYQGCDSVTAVSLIVDTLVRSSNSLEICYGDSALFSGLYYNVSGTYFDTLQAQAGCDSISEFNLLVKDFNFNVSDTLQLCYGDSILLNGIYQTESGTYYDTLQTNSGCDSILEIYIDTLPRYLTTLFLSICSSDSAFLEGGYKTISGFYFDTLQSVSGCDSILKTELLVDSIVNINISSQICQNDSILFGNIYLDTSGIYYDTVTNVSACDTIYIFDLQVNPLNINIIDSTVCSIYITPSGDTVSSSGVFYDTLSSYNGCDSIIVYDITINTIFSTITDTTCGIYTSPSGNLYTVTGTYIDSLISSSGCDSIITINLTIYCDDIDGDGIPDDEDDDNDNDGISDDDEGTGDSDGDGIPDYLDIDSDNDGIYDVVEYGNGEQDTNNDGVIDIDDTGFTDIDNNGMADNSQGTNNSTDTDGDGIPDYLDLDSDNDGIYDVVESGNGNQDTNNDGVVDSNDTGFTDNNNNGMADGTEGSTIPDSDSDGVPDFIDLDSDNDGIYDVVESGNGNQDTNNDGVINSNDSGFGDSNSNGIADSTEGSILVDTDGDGIPDFLDSDSDGDGCDDVVESGFTDDDGDGYLGDTPLLIDSLGIVTSGVDGYTNPNDLDSNGIFDFLEEGSEAVFDAQLPEIIEFSESDNITINGTASSLSTIYYQWEISSDDGFNWANIIDDSTFSGSLTSTLLISNIYKKYDQYLVRLTASTPGFICGSDQVTGPTRLQLDQIIVPQGFSPNGDGINDTWHISGIDKYSVNKVEVYNRWEVKVWQVDNYSSENEWDGSSGWDGSTNTHNNLVIGDGGVPEGTYFYIIDFSSGPSGIKPLKGYVYIRR